MTYRIALGPHQGRKAFTLQTPSTASWRGPPAFHSGRQCPSPFGQPAALQIGIPAESSLHAGVACEAHEREKLERLCCYITRPAVSTELLSLTTQGNIR